MPLTDCRGYYVFTYSNQVEGWDESEFCDLYQFQLLDAVRQLLLQGYCDLTILIQRFDPDQQDFIPIDHQLEESIFQTAYQP